MGCSLACERSQGTIAWAVRDSKNRPAVGSFFQCNREFVPQCIIFIPCNVSSDIHFHILFAIPHPCIWVILVSYFRQYHNACII